jgi:RNA polymerase sigma factor (sigma-70 family)
VKCRYAFESEPGLKPKWVWLKRFTDGAAVALDGRDVPAEAFARGVIRNRVKWLSVCEVRRKRYLERPQPGKFAVRAEVEAERDAGIRAIDRRMEEAEAFERLIAELHERKKEVLRLRFRDGLTFPEIGERLDITEGRATKLYWLAIERLRLRWGDGGGRPD